MKPAKTRTAALAHMAWATIGPTDRSRPRPSAWRPGGAARPVTVSSPGARRAPRHRRPGRAARAERRRRPAARRRRLLAERGRFRRGVIDLVRDPGPEHGGPEIDEGADPQYPGRAGHALDSEGDRSGHRRGQHGAQPVAGIRRHQRDLGGQQPRGHRAPGDRVGLLQHEHAEGGREERNRITGDRAGHRPAQQAAGQHRAHHDVPAPLPDPVQHGPDKRCKQREWRHGEDEVEHDLTARLVQGGIEEHGPGQGHGHEGVPGTPRRGQLDETRQAGAARARRAAQPVHEPSQPPVRGDARPRGRLGRMAGCPPCLRQSHGLSIRPSRGCAGQTAANSAIAGSCSHHDERE